MKTVFLFIFFCFIIGCNSLPRDIAFHTGQTSNNCKDATIKTFNALQSLEYKKVTYCQGWAWKGHSKLHAWVEYQDENGDIRILDSYCILEEGVYEYWREDLTDWEYQKKIITITEENKYEKMGRTN